MADRLATVAQFASYIEAGMARQLLADYGIKAVVTGQNVADTFAGVPAVVNIELQTLEAQAEETLEILQSESRPVDAPPDDEQEK